jgi:LysR family transcriptional regulator, regulator for metE and metH
MLERSHLRIVREVERQGSLTAAAKQLHLTQSALSHAMRKLERALGADIWQREGRSLRLTQAGQRLLSVASRVLPQLENADTELRQLARGTRGSLRIGMECHPCYQWLLKVVARYMPAWADVDVDVMQKFRFGGIGALLDHEIDLVVTPDPEARPGLTFIPVFDYEQVLVVSRSHALAGRKHVEPQQLAEEVLITYPVTTDRLDIYNLFLTPAGITPRAHKAIESTDLIMQMVAAGRGVGALPRWLVEEYAAHVAVVPLRLGRKGVPKQIHLGLRAADLETKYLRAFIDTAREVGR